MSGELPAFWGFVLSHVYRHADIQQKSPAPGQEKPQTAQE